MDNTRDQIYKFLYPDSVAIVGASNNTAKTGGRLLSYFLKHNYVGNVYPVHPREATIQGLKAYPSVASIPDQVDLAFLVVSNQQIFDVLKDCAAKGVTSVVVSTSGFSEAGPDGEKLQNELIEFAKASGIRLCGPNTIGLVNTNKNLFLSFSMSMEMENIPEGSISFISQSGAIGGGILSRAWEEGTGINFCISSGNEADLDTADFLDFLLTDDHTKVICLFLEGVKDGHKFRNVLKKAKELKKPIVVYKNGRTKIGQESVKSHTGSMAGSYRVYQSIFKQYGVVSVENLEEMIDSAKAFSALPLPKGKRIGIISTSGGACTILADHCIESGLSIPQLDAVHVEKLKGILPSYASVKNPLDTSADIIANPQMFKGTLQTFIDDDNMDAIIVMLTTVGEPIASRIADDIIALHQRSDKPILIAWSIAESLAANGMAKLKKAQIPVYSSADKAVKVVGHMVAFEHFHRKKKAVLQ